MEIRISKEDFMKIIKRVAKSMLGSVSALNASTIISNNELIYQGTKALIVEIESIGVFIWMSFIVFSTMKQIFVIASVK